MKALESLRQVIYALGMPYTAEIVLYIEKPENEYQNWMKFVSFCFYKQIFVFRLMNCPNMERQVLVSLFFRGLFVRLFVFLRLCHSRFLPIFVDSIVNIKNNTDTFAALNALFLTFVYVWPSQCANTWRVCMGVHGVRSRILDDAIFRFSNFFVFSSEKVRHWIRVGICARER